MKLKRTVKLQKTVADDNQFQLHNNFPSSHFLSKQENVLNVLSWCTFWRRNLHRFAADYLQISLYPYQQLTLYELGVSNRITIIASRNNAKSFIIALYACCRCILYPGTLFTIGSATKGQAKLIVSEKIETELAEWSPVLKSEIAKISTSINDIYVKFKNGSKITVFTANDNARGNRSHVSCREEFRQIPKKIEDSVISPFQTVRQRNYMNNPFYGENEVLQENPVDIYISSSWVDDGHWMWTIVDQSFQDMLDSKGSVLLTFDEAITLKHHLKTKQQLIKEKKKQDPVSWATEFLNLRVKESTSSPFTYSMLYNRQVSKRAFYPRDNMDYRANVKNQYYIPKQNGEIRVISNDIAFVAGSANDNSVYSCIRAIPETQTFENENHTVSVEKGYHRIVPYLEANQIGDTTKQAVRIRQLYEDFEADYIVIDARNGGVQIIYTLQKPLYDEERGVEYAPLKCMNNDKYADFCADPNAKSCIYAITASVDQNTDIALNFRRNLSTNNIDFLVGLNTAKEEILSTCKEYQDSIANDDIETQIKFEAPFLETQAMISESSQLTYEKLPNTGKMRIVEKSTNTKDRYTSVSYGSYFIDCMELDDFNSNSDYEYSCLCN